MAQSLPFNSEAEMSVLGISFISKDQVDKICESVNEDMFFDERNKTLFCAIKSLHDKKIPIDITTISTELDKTKKSSIVNINYIMDVIDSVVTSANLDYYIQILQDYNVRRGLITSATQIVENAYNEEEI